MQRLSDNKSLGLTLVELIIAMTVLGLLLGVVMGPLGDYYTDSTSTISRTTQDTDTRGVLRSIGNDLATSAGFLATLEPAATPLGSNNDMAAWYYCGVGDTDCTTPTSYRVLMGLTYATDKSHNDDTRLPVFLQSGGSCDTSPTSAVKNTYIYFAAPDPVKTTTYNLYRRTIVNTTGGTYCTGTQPFQKQTCAPSKVAASPSVCAASDAKILSNIAAFTIDYYTSPNDAEPYADTYNSSIASSTREATVMAARSIKVTVGTYQNINGTDSQVTSSIRISL